MKEVDKFDARINSLKPSNLKVRVGASEHLESRVFGLFNHGLGVLSAPFEEQGVIIAVIADQKGAPTEDSVIAGPTFLLQQPASLVGKL